MSVSKGQRYRAKADVKITCMTAWAAPYTGGDDRVVVIADDPAPQATAVYADPENYDALHAAMVAAADRDHMHYRGYYLCIGLAQLQTEFELL